MISSAFYFKPAFLIDIEDINITWAGMDTY